LRLFVTELAVVHDPADGWIRQRRDFDEIEIQRAGHRQRFGKGLDSDLASIGTDEADLTRTNALVVPGLVLLRRCYGCSLLCNGLFSLFDDRRRRRKVKERTANRSHTGGHSMP
jgi:hypothetical protein